MKNSFELAEYGAEQEGCVLAYLINNICIFVCFSCVRGDFIKLFLHLEGRGEVNEYTPWASLLCGSYTDIPQVFYSSGPGLVFEFHSDHIHTNSTGFKGTFRFLDKRK